MSTTEWIVIGLIVVVVAIIGMVVAARIASSRRRAHLQDRFGPEYDRAVAEASSRSQAEDALADRERRHAELELKPLSEAARTRYLVEWQAVQLRFVDNPGSAAEQAEQLVHRVLTDRGYPADEGQSAAAEAVSVDHPDVVQRYRRGCEALAAPSEEHQVRTENLRKAMVDFRAVFESLLEPEGELAEVR